MAAVHSASPSPFVNPDKLLTAGAVSLRFGISVRTLLRWVQRGTFPPPIRLSRMCVRWRASTVEAVLADRQSA